MKTDSPTAASSGPSPPSARLLSTAKVSEMLGLTEQRLRVLRMTGNGPVFTRFSDKPNAVVYYFEEAVAAWRAALPRHRKTSSFKGSRRSSVGRAAGAQILKVVKRQQK